MRSSNAAVVLRTLVPQAREIFRLLAQAQLAPDADEEGCEGVLLRSRPPTHAMLGDTYSVSTCGDSSAQMQMTLTTDHVQCLPLHDRVCSRLHMTAYLT